MTFDRERPWTIDRRSSLRLDANQTEIFEMPQQLDDGGKRKRVLIDLHPFEQCSIEHLRRKTRRFLHDRQRFGRRGIQQMRGSDARIEHHDAVIEVSEDETLAFGNPPSQRRVVGLRVYAEEVARRQSKKAR